MVQRLFQDPAGTIPAILPGQPVGLIKRLAGTLDATQATALSKPTLARWPWGGKKLIQNRNVWDLVPLGVLLNSYSLNGFMVRGGAEGITVEVQARGYDENGLPYIDLKYSGQNNGASVQFLNIINDDVVPLLSGVGNVQVSSLVTVLAGSLGNSASVASFQQYVNFRDAGGGTLSGASAYFVLAQGVERRVTLNAPPLAGAISVINRGIYIRVPIGQPVDAVLRVKALQSSFEPDAPFQIIRSPNDITEPGVKDLWHLYNDGGDSLDITIPPGVWGVANLAIDRSYRIESISFNEGGTITTLLGERQIDCIYRRGAWSPAEILAIQQYWERMYG